MSEGTETPKADERDTASAQTIAQLVAAMHAAGRFLNRVKFAGHPVNPTPFLVEAITLILKSQAFLLDEMRAMQGKERTIQITADPSGGNGRRLIHDGEVEGNN